MFEVLFDLPLNLHLYAMVMAALLPFSFHVFSHYFEGSYLKGLAFDTSTGFERSLTKGDVSSPDLPKDTHVFIITKCVKRKEAPDGDQDDHPILLTP
ncbi:hypothetical protein [Thalassobacillus devorans]|uniref:hypothetical protein n=1 Tax=Thalassobacillus devorans TaxID=279813 RepID=UPI00048E4115|nr:hypothetical protein [Thalassobacillus devorans]